MSREEHIPNINMSATPESREAELALSVPKIMAGKPISVYAVDPSEQQNIHMQKDDKTSSEKVRCVICKKAFEEGDTESLVCGHQSVCRTCNSTRDCSTCTTCGKITVRCVTCKKSFEEADTESLVCGHQSVCNACIMTPDSSTCTICGKITVRCVICKKSFEEADTEPLVCGHQSVCRTCNSTRDCSTCTTWGKITVRCFTCKKSFEETDTKPLVCGHQSVCNACIMTSDCSTCTICGKITGSSSFGDIEVNSNKKQTDKQNQRLESSEYTFEPDKEQRGTDKEQRMKSSMSIPWKMHERLSGYKVKATHVRNINVADQLSRHVGLKDDTRYDRIVFI